MSATIANGNGTTRFASLRACAVFPNRTSLHAREIARVLSISVDQVELLKDAGHFEALPIGLGGDRCRYRITVASYDQFIMNGGSISAATCRNGHSKNGHSKNGNGHRPGARA
jgi:hypothetical protein